MCNLVFVACCFLFFFLIFPYFSLFWLCLVADFRKSTWLLLAQFVLLFSCVHRFSSMLFFSFVWFFSLPLGFQQFRFVFGCSFRATQIFISLWMLLLLLLLFLFRFSSLLCYVIYLAVARENVVKKFEWSIRRTKTDWTKTTETNDFFFFDKRFYSQCTLCIFVWKFIFAIDSFNRTKIDII